MTEQQLYADLSDLAGRYALAMAALANARADIEKLRVELEESRQKMDDGQQVWFSPAEAAQFAGCSVPFLAKDRLQKEPRVPFVRHGHRTVSYHRNDLVAYMEAKKMRSSRLRLVA